MAVMTAAKIGRRGMNLFIDEKHIHWFSAIIREKKGNRKFLDTG